MDYRTTDITVRALGEMKIGGTASVYFDGTPGTQYQLFENAFERINVGAWDSVIRSNPDVLALFNHDPNYPLARTPDTLQLRADNTGLHYELTLPNTTAGRDLYALVEAGIVRGSSFGGLIGYARWQKENDKDVRVIHRFSALRDVSPVSFPAYSGTKATLRSDDVTRLIQERDLSYATQARISLARNWKQPA